MKILVTAGPTREPIDPVRFLSNRSSGKMGHAVAAVGAERGHRICLVTGPTFLPAPRGVRVVRVQTAREMLRAVLHHVKWADVLVMAAAVADWRPLRAAVRKMKKGSGRSCIRLVRNPDILMCVSRLRRHPRLVGFAAETGDPVREARRKLRQKGLEMVVANDVSRRGSGFDVDTNRASLVMADGTVRRLPLMRKRTLARLILEQVESMGPGPAPSGRIPRPS